MRSVREIRDDLREVRESLDFLVDTERSLLEDVGGTENLTLGNVGEWADEIRRCRELIAGRRASILQLEAELSEAVRSGQDANPEQVMEAT